MKIDLPPIAPLHHVEQPTMHEDVATSSVSDGGLRTANLAKDAARFAAALGETSKSLNDRELLAGDIAQFGRSMKVQELYGLLMGPQAAGMAAAVGRMRKLLRQQAQDVLPAAELQDRTMTAIMALAENDPAVAHVLIQAALKEARKPSSNASRDTAGESDAQGAAESGANEESENLERYAQLLQAQHGTRLRAGLNTAKAFAKATRDPKRRKSLRDEYYSTVIGDQTLVKMIGVLLDNDPTHPNPTQESFSAALNTLKSAIADDLASLRPSHKSSHLKTLMKGLATAARLGTLFEHCNRLLARMSTGQPSPGITAPSLLRELLGIGEQRAHGVVALVTRMAGTSLKRQLTFLNALGPVMKAMEPWWKIDKNSKNPFANLLLLRNQLTTQEKRLKSGPPVVALSGPGSASDPQRVLSGSNAANTLPRALSSSTVAS